MFAAYLLRPRPLYKSQEMLDPSQVHFLGAKISPWQCMAMAIPKITSKNHKVTCSLPTFRAKLHHFIMGHGATLRIGVKSW
jgi:hypothetical protein